MPRASNGTYSLYTPGNPVQTLTTISSAWANNTLDDIAQALTDSLSRTGNGGMQAPLALAAGAIGTPGLTWSNETTSGLYRAGAGDFRWAISGVDVFTITSTGISPVGISGTIGGNPTWTGTHTFNGVAKFTSDGGGQLSAVQTEANQPSISFNELDAATNSKWWQLTALNGSFVLQARQDGGSSGGANTALSISRTGTTIDSIALASTALTWNGQNVPNVASSPTWTGHHTFTQPPTISNTSPYMMWDETDGGTDQRLWRASVSSAIWRLQTLTDGGSTGAQPILISRTGTTVSSIELSSTAFKWNGQDVPNVASSPTWTGVHTFAQPIKATAAGGGAFTPFIAESTQPGIAFNETDAGTDEKWWQVTCLNGAFAIQARQDGGNDSGAQTALSITRSGTTVATITLSAAPVTGTIALSAGSVTVNGNEVGYRGVRQIRNISGDAVTNTTDPGGVIVYTGIGGHTLTLSTGVPAKEIIIVMNGGTGNLTISSGGVGSMSWYNGSGSISSGNRTLAVGGVATLLSSGSNVWSIWGSGLS